MRRASVSRRQQPDSGLVMVRARSSERLGSGGGDENGASSAADVKDDRFEDSEHIGKPIRVHRRALSDPFDTQEDITSTKGDSDLDDDVAMFREEEEAFAKAEMVAKNKHRRESGSLPIATMPRFPVGDTRNKNCFSEPPVSIFHVRGSKYFSDKKKTESGPYLLSARGCDLFLTDNNASKPVNLSSRDHLIMGGQLRRKPTLSINFRFPWGYMNLYFEIASHLAVYLNPNTPLAEDGSLTTAEKTLAAWLQGDTDYKNERLKLIPYVAEGPWVVRNMVTGKPAIIGKKLPVSYELAVATQTEAPLLTATLDIGSSSATAKRIVSVCRRYMSALTVDIGFVIQAEHADELPEQMMGSIRVHHADPLKAPKL